MSLECSECERDLRGGHDPSCSRYKPWICTNPLKHHRFAEYVNGCPKCEPLSFSVVHESTLETDE